MAAELQRTVGGESLYFYDAIAPIVLAETISPAHSFRASRWGRDGENSSGEGDYINCPLDRETYYTFVEEIAGARKIAPHGFEEPRFFDGCLPIEVMVDRGADVLRYGPMRPIGLRCPRTGERPFAVVQLRPENRYLSSYNLVGFQTRLAYPEQKRIFSLIPALAEAEFLRFGSIHRNTFLDSPRVLGADLSLLGRPELRFAGLLTGVEGYIESCAMGFLAALFTDASLAGRELPPPPTTTAFGGLYHHISGDGDGAAAFGPTNINYGLLPRLEGKHKKRDRKPLMAERARGDFTSWLANLALPAGS